MEFRVDLATFRGPLDLLLYLVRKHEVEVADIPIAPITAQFLAYLAVLRQLDMSAVGEFVDMASTLLEIKSRMVLPHGGEETAELPDPRHELVERLLEYKKFKDAASMLEERGRDWQQRFARRADDAAPRVRDLAAEELHEVELWDLVSAFGRIMRDRQALQPSTIVYDETPIRAHMARIQALLAERGRLALSELFEPAPQGSRLHKSRLVGIFLAVLELVRHKWAEAEQSELFGEVWLLPGAEADKPLDFSAVDEYESANRREPPNDRQAGEKHEAGGVPSDSSLLK